MVRRHHIATVGASQRGNLPQAAANFVAKLVVGRLSVTLAPIVQVTRHDYGSDGDAGAATAGSSAKRIET